MDSAVHAQVWLVDDIYVCMLAVYVYGYVRPVCRRGQSQHNHLFKCYDRGQNRQIVRVVRDVGHGHAGRKSVFAA